MQGIKILQYNYPGRQIKYKMSHEETSPALIPSQKSMSEQRQANSIRKITIQTLSPIITKLEEHISYLLQQTSKLRNENAKLTIATANQQALQKQFDILNQNMEKISTKMNAFNKDKDSKLKERENEIKILTQDLQYMKKQMELHGKQIDQISANNEQYLSRIDQNKLQQLQGIEHLKANIENYYEQQMIKIQAIKEEFEDTKHHISALQEKRNADQQQMKQILNITSLYEAERGDIKKMIQKTTYIENNVVMLPDYQKDKKYQKIDNQQTKKQIKNMLDEALTPQIRRFLPKLISKLSDLQQFQSILTSVQTKIKENKINQDNQINEMTDTWNKKFNLHQKANQNELDSIKKAAINNYEALQEKIEILEQKLSNRIRPIQQQLKVMQKRWKSNLQKQSQSLENQIKDYLNIWGDKFLDRKKDNIYQLVQSQKPPQLKKEENRIQQLVYSMQPLLNSVRQQLKAAQNQMQSSKETLYERLSFFNNQIVKIKSDITKESTETKRVMDVFSLKLLQSKDTCNDLSLLISKLMETTIISYALSLDQSYLQRDREVYVTYNDGILMQITENGKVNYRRQEYIPELLKRAVLSELVKIIDNSIVGRPLLNWGKPELKPSHLAQQIQNNYQVLLEQNKNITPRKVASNRLHHILDKKQIQGRQNDKKEHQNHSQYRQSTNQQIFSKTIDTDRHGFRAFHSATRYDIGHQQNGQYTGRRKNIKLKRIDKKQA